MASREEAARETRRRIVSTAADRVLEGGYRAMTIASLASDAGVSPQTVYNSVGGKAEVIKAVYDTMLAGDHEPVPMSERPEFVAVQEAGDAESWATAYAHWTRLIWDRVGGLVGVLLDHGPAGDPVLEELVASMDRERRTGNDNSLKGLVRIGLLPTRAVARKHTADVVWTVTSPDVYDRLVVRCGWSTRSYELWLAAQLEAAVTGLGLTTRSG
jgi:AcrR family transcriptional regulator